MSFGLSGKMTFYIRIRIFDPKCFIDPPDRERAAAREPAQHGQAAQFFVGKARAFFDEYDVFDADQPSFRRETGKLDVGLHGSFFSGPWQEAYQGAADRPFGFSDCRKIVFFCRIFCVFGF